MGRRNAGTVANWLDEHFADDRDDCLISPYRVSKSGYLRFGPKKKKLAAHRYVLMKANPEGFFKGAQAAHRCGNRACVNHRHLYWATNKQNADDRVLHGTHAIGGQNPRARLTEADVLEMRKLRHAGTPLSALIKKYGVSKTSIAEACNGYRWKHLPQETAFRSLRIVKS